MGKERAAEDVPSSLEDDYDQWEAGVSEDDVLEIQREILREDQDDAWDEGPAIDAGDEEEDGDVIDAEENVSTILNPAFSEFPFRSRRRDRSQTAPLLDNSDDLIPESQYSTSPGREPGSRTRRQALHRHHSSGAQLDVLREAYAVVVEGTGVSQLGVEELLQMRRIASRIGETVDEQISEKLGITEGGAR